VGIVIKFIIVFLFYGQSFAQVGSNYRLKPSVTAGGRSANDPHVRKCGPRNDEFEQLKKIRTVIVDQTSAYRPGPSSEYPTEKFANPLSIDQNGVRIDLDPTGKIKSKIKF
jgi:hypothetical protein